MEVSMVIVSYNSQEYVHKLLESILKYIVGDNSVGLEVIVVENGSVGKWGGELEQFRNNINIKLIELGKNLGYGGAFNAVVKDIKSEFVVIANADIEFTSAPFIDLVHIMKESPNRIGVIGLQQVYPNGERQRSSGSFVSVATLLSEVFFVYKLKMFSKNNSKLKEVDYVDGAFMMFRTTTLKGFGCFDESFFFYFEDMDICMASKKAGYINVILRTHKLIHHRGGNSKDGKLLKGIVLDYFADSYYKFIEKWYGKEKKVIYFLLRINIYKNIILGKALYFFTKRTNYLNQVNRYLKIKEYYDSNV